MTLRVAFFSGRELNDLDLLLSIRNEFPTIRFASGTNVPNVYLYSDMVSPETINGFHKNQLSLAKNGEFDVHIFTPSVCRGVIRALDNNPNAGIRLVIQNCHSGLAFSEAEIKQSFGVGKERQFKYLQREFTPDLIGRLRKMQVMLLLVSSRSRLGSELTRLPQELFRELSTYL